MSNRTRNVDKPLGETEHSGLAHCPYHTALNEWCEAWERYGVALKAQFFAEPAEQEQRKQEAATLYAEQARLYAAVPNRQQTMAALRRAGCPDTQIAQQYGISRQRVHQLLGPRGNTQ